MARDHRRESGDGGSFWTSYSDLFSGLCIIFLVLFFFATIRAGVEQLKHKFDRQQTAEYMKGKIPEDVAKKNQQQQKTVKESLSEIQQKKEMLEKSALQVAQLVQDLNQHQGVLKEMMDDQVEKTTMLRVANEKNTSLESDVAKLQKIKEELETSIREREQRLLTLDARVSGLEQEKVALENNTVALSQELQQKEKTLAQTETSIADLKQTMAEKEQAAEQAKIALETENSNLTLSLQHKEAELTQTNQKIQDLDAQLAKRAQVLEQMQQKLSATESQVQQSAETLKQREDEIAQVNAKLESISAQLSQRELLNSQLQKKLKDMESVAVKTNASLEQREAELAQKTTQMETLSAQLTQKQTSIEKLNQKLTDSQKEIHNLRATVGFENTKLTLALQQKDNELQKTQAQLQNAKADMQGQKQLITQLNKRAEDHAANIAGLKADHNNALAGLKNQLQGLQSELKLERLESEGLKRQLASKDASGAAARSELEKANQRLTEAAKKIAQLETDKRNYQSDLDQAKLSLAGMQGILNHEKTRNSSLENRAKTCEMDLASIKQSDQTKNRKIASLDDALKKTQSQLVTLEEQRRGIASKVRDTMRQSGVDVEVDPESGVMTLSMDEVFHFKNGSAELSDTAKKKLNKIMPIYARSLFGNAENASKIASITISGHASPRYRQKYVDPFGKDEVARIFNMNLSKQRAKQVATYVFGSEIGAFPYKELFRRRTKVVGKGFGEPIKVKPGAKAEEQCGVYDCSKSRRVEITFLLKEEKKAPPAVRVPASPVKKE